MLCPPQTLNSKNLTSNPLVTRWLKIWAQFRSHFKKKQALSLLPITSNALFPPSLIDHASQTWFRKEVRCVRNIFQGYSFISFECMISDFDIPKSNFPRYQQVRSLKKYFSTFLTPPSHSWIEEFLNWGASEWGLISKVYSLIQRAAYRLFKGTVRRGFGSVVSEAV